MSEITAYELFCVFPKCQSDIHSGGTLIENEKNIYFCKEHAESFTSHSGKSPTHIQCRLCDENVKFLVGNVFFCKTHYDHFKNFADNN